MQANLANLAHEMSTPMMKQYHLLKSDYPDFILFFRLGDFYEMFFEDAKKAAKILNIALTKRGQEIPMCGIPFHSADSYIAKLIKEEQKIAICEQMETPDQAKQRGYKAIVRREVVRLITPGTLLEEMLLDKVSNNFLLAICLLKDNLALAWCDVSTGDLLVCQTNLTAIASEIAKIAPKEILISENDYQNESLKKNLAPWHKLLTIQANNIFNLKRAEHKLLEFYKIKALHGFGQLSSDEIIACGVILEYVSLTHKNEQYSLKKPKKIEQNNFLKIDQATQKNLELFGSSVSLFNFLNQCKTSAGSRLLYNFINYPLIELEAINKRQALVEFFHVNSKFCNDFIAKIALIGDVERAIARLAFTRGGPRDLAIVRDGLNAINSIIQLVNDDQQALNFLNKYFLDFADLENLQSHLNQALSCNLPFLARDGNFINPDFNQRLFDLTNLTTDSKKLLADLRNKYVALSNIPNLKISFNNILGYFIEVNPQYSSKLDNNLFIHRQGLANAARFTTLELQELANQLTNLNQDILNQELAIYQQLVDQLLAVKDLIFHLINNIATLDVASNFALIALQNNYIKPTINAGNNLKIIQGRHPVIERNIIAQRNNFIANDCEFSIQERIKLLTGPNMAGKSTYLRQNALIVIMAQIGSFIPADFAEIGIVDQIFSRIGAGDDLARGYSTFMIEMLETAYILNNASERSLIILDEIGRGTSTYDGVSIAMACIEYLHNFILGRTLFATHYLELAQMSSNLTSLKCFTMQIKEWHDNIIFLHKVIPGVTDRSYGIHVAEFAGLPKGVINRAKEILDSLEQNSQFNNLKEKDSVFKQKNDEDLVKKMLENTNIDEITPKQALQMLYQLKEHSYRS